MGYLVTVTFDLHEPATNLSKQDRIDLYGNAYAEVYEELEKKAIFGTARADNGGAASLPESTATGKFPEELTKGVANEVYWDVKKIFEAIAQKHAIQYTIFVTFGTRWVWGRTGAKDVTGSSSGIPRA
jgi:hypothetical protein